MHNAARAMTLFAGNAVVPLIALNAYYFTDTRVRMSRLYARYNIIIIAYKAMTDII